MPIVYNHVQFLTSGSTFLEVISRCQSPGLKNQNLGSNINDLGSRFPDFSSNSTGSRLEVPTSSARFQFLASSLQEQVSGLMFQILDSKLQNPCSKFLDQIQSLFKISVPNFQVSDWSCPRSSIQVPTSSSINYIGSRSQFLNFRLQVPAVKLHPTSSF